MAYSNEGAVIQTAFQSKHSQELVQLRDESLVQEKKVQLSTVQEMRESILVSNVPQQQLRLSQEFTNVYEPSTLHKYRASLQDKLLTYKRMRVNTKENESRLNLQLRKLFSLSGAVRE